MKSAKEIASKDVISPGSPFFFFPSTYFSRAKSFLSRSQTKRTEQATGVFDIKLVLNFK